MIECDGEGSMIDECFWLKYTHSSFSILESLSIYYCFILQYSIPANYLFFRLRQCTSIYSFIVNLRFFYCAIVFVYVHFQLIVIRNRIESDFSYDSTQHRSNYSYIQTPIHAGTMYTLNCNSRWFPNRKHKLQNINENKCKNLIRLQFPFHSIVSCRMNRIQRLYK